MTWYMCILGKFLRNVIFFSRIYKTCNFCILGRRVWNSYIYTTACMLIEGILLKAFSHNALVS